jgi:hypothetical protein
MIRKLLLPALLLNLFFPVSAQSLQPGFSGHEYMDMLSISFQYFDTARINPRIPAPKNYTTVYRSPETGLKNCWNMWYRKDNKVAVIAIRGTVNAAASWMENNLL